MPTPIKSEKLALFDMPPQKGETVVHGDIFKDGEEYTAVIAGGWWIGRGKTREAAIQAVIKVWNDEMEYASR